MFKEAPHSNNYDSYKCAFPLELEFLHSSCRVNNLNNFLIYVVKDSFDFRAYSYPSSTIYEK